MKQYDADFFRWTQETSDQLRRGEFAPDRRFGASGRGGGFG